MKLINYCIERFKGKKSIPSNLLLTFLPSIYYFVTIRNSEKHNKEKYLPIMLCYLWGMFPGVILTLLLYLLLDILFLNRLLLNLSDNNKEIIMASIIAPIVEEIAKGSGLFFFTKKIDEEEDAHIYGAISGLGFATIENVLYSLNLTENNEITFNPFIMIIRYLTSTILHIYASSKFGEGVYTKNKKIYIMSILYHAFANFILFTPTPLNFFVFVFLTIFYNILFKNLKKEISNKDIKTKENKKL